MTRCNKWMYGVLATILAMLASLPVQAEKILLQQSNNTVTEWGGNGSSGLVECSNCGGGGGSVGTSTIASGITTNTTTSLVAGVAGDKTYWAHVTGTGAVTATVEHFGCQTNATTYCVLLGTITLSGTTAKYDVPTPSVGSANYPYHYIVTTNVTGTGATVSAGVNY